MTTACYRLIPHVLLKNTRTLYRAIPKQSPAGEFWKKYDGQLTKWTTLTKKRDCELLRVRGNVRVLVIKSEDPPKIDKRNVYCAIRVGVGFKDDPVTCQGLAHLLEHIISMEAYRDCPNTFSFDSVTSEFETIYSFIVTLRSEDNAPAFAAIEAFSKYLFSRSALESRSNIKETTEMELQIVDNEFHEKLNYKNFRKIHKMAAILETEGLHLFKFGAGNKKTLNQIDRTNLIKEFEKLRELYRQRPLNVCIYSAHKLEMKKIFESLNCEDFLITSHPQKSPKPSCEHSNGKDLSKHLFVVQSNNDLLQLNLLYPLNGKLNIKENNTFEFLIEMIACEIDGYLAHDLIHRKLGTKCEAILSHNTFLIAVNLTEKGLQNVHQVSFTIRQYLHFLYDEWENLDKFNYRKDSVVRTMRKVDSEPNYAKFIASYWDEGSDEFDEHDVCAPLDRDEERNFISMRILHNKNVIHIILDRQPERVNTVLRASHPHLFPNNSRKLTEPIYDTTFHIHQTELFKMEGNSTKFSLVDLRKFPDKKAAQTMKFRMFCMEPMDVVFQRLYITYLSWQSAHYRAIYEQLYPGHSKFHRSPGGIYYKARADNASELKTYFKNWSHFEMQEEDFTLCKARLMADISDDMTDSDKLVGSLMSTAVHNLHNPKRKMKIPIPIQYKTLMPMSRSDYLQYLNKTHGRKFDATVDVPSDNNNPYAANFSIKSMNTNQLITVTSFFCQTDPKYTDGRTEHLENVINTLLLQMKQELGVYTSGSSIKTVAGVKGIFIKIKSVEGKANQTGEKVRKICEDVITETIPTKLQNNRKLMSPYTYLMQRRILVQITGYTESRITENSFDNDFDIWYNEHKDEFERFTQIGK